MSGDDIRMQVQCHCRSDSRDGHLWDPPACPSPPALGLRAVPNTPGTPRRTIRVSDALWNAAQAKAEEQGTDVSAVIRKALERFIRRR